MVMGGARSGGLQEELVQTCLCVIYGAVRALHRLHYLPFCPLIHNTVDHKKGSVAVTLL